MASLYRPRGCRIWHLKYRVDGRLVRQTSGTADKREARRRLVLREAAAAAGKPVDVVTAITTVGRQVPHARWAFFAAEQCGLRSRRSPGSPRCGSGSCWGRGQQGGPVNPEIFPDYGNSALEAGRLVAQLWGGTLTPAGRTRLAELGGTWCPTCYAYQLREHVCWTPEVVERLRADAAMRALHEAALADDAALGESMHLFGLALFHAVYGEDAPLPVDGPAGADEDPARPEGA